MTQNNPRCYCGNEKEYANCCGQFHSGADFAKTAEQLMRSRYSAFCTANADYLIATHHPSKRSADEKVELERNFASIRWLGLQIIRTERGQVDDTTGVVEFEARCVQDEAISSLHEASQFVKEEGRWFYLSGELKPVLSPKHVGESVDQKTLVKKTQNSSSQQKLGRNDICFCGSGKKYKKCHGA